MQKILIFFVCILSASFIYAQGEIDEQDVIALRNERTFGLLLTSNGWAVNFRYAQRRDGFRKKLYTIDLAELKHDKEIKSSNPYYASSSRYVYGKSNFVITLRGGLGMQKEFISKRDKGGISIRYFYTYGPSLAFMKPIYYEILHSNPPVVKDEKFDPDLHQLGNIIGKASISKGLDEIKVSPGAFLKAGLTFEFSKEDKKFNAFEVGAMVEGYIRKIDIISTEAPQYHFISLFVSYRFGKAIRAMSLKG